MRNVDVTLQIGEPKAVRLAKMLVRLLLVAVSTAVLSMPQANRPANVVFDQVRSHHKGIALWWVGNAGWLIKSNDVLIGTDLDLGTQAKVQPPPITAEVSPGPTWGTSVEPLMPP